MAARTSVFREPKSPAIPATLAAAGIAETELADDGVYLSLRYGAVPITGAEDVEFERCRFEGTGLAGVTLHRAGFADVAFDGCDLANARMFTSRMFSTAVRTCRMTGLHLAEAGLRDVLFDGCRADLASFRFAHLRDVVFRDCNLSEANFQKAELTRVRFERCRLAGTQFSGAAMKDARFTGCDLSGVGGIRSFDGATVGTADARTLLDALAAEAGITIAD
ncbi:pentapeptide repeat-containing protein [Actinomadura parmotrematis]|uniref:Pentapeptide repeat-containing protein n=1 Tax=Actinomadura parmotrematis TaxID=2864039 RepID=A0ABS7FY62_9ACTN|nr:pentapeptide repeat-containing protein [Actinomadura parmotrematis]MBW8484388.1 pentapeptide repeat-containing protein [Actinomadura parmotrematis]